MKTIFFVAGWPEQRCRDSEEGLDIDDLLKTERNINKIIVESWKSFIAYLLGLANENICREQILNCVTATFAAQAGSQHHGHTIKTTETTIKDTKSEKFSCNYVRNMGIKLKQLQPLLTA